MTGDVEGYVPEEEERTYTRPDVDDGEKRPEERRERKVYEELVNRRFGPAVDIEGLSEDAKQEILVGLKEHAKDLAKEQVRAEIDDLTGLWREKGLEKFYDIELEQMDSYEPDEVMLLAAIDLDHFKRINDTLGHKGADKILEQFGQDFRDVFRNTDIGGRPGGDEFVFLFPRVKEGDVDKVMIKLEEMVRSIGISDELGNLTASTGVKVIKPGDKLYYEDARKEADFAAYAAKRAGRNRWFRSDSEETRETERGEDWFFVMLKEESKRRMEGLSRFPELIKQFEDTLKSQAKILFEAYKKENV